MDSGTRAVVLRAALEEMLESGLDDLTTESIAARAGVECAVITGQWGDRRVLFLEAAIKYARENFVVPDNGNLRDDLLGVAAALVRVPHPRWFARALAVGGDADLSEIRLDYWRVRADDVAVVFRRAADRGELRDDVDPVDAIQMFVGAVLQDPIFTGSPVRPEYVAQLVDVFVRGVGRGAAG